MVRLIENAEMSAAAEKIVRRMGLSGLCGFDFMQEASTGKAYLIEINPRATQVGHLTLGGGRDLPAALYGAVTGQAIRVAPAVTENPIIRFFRTSGPEIRKANSSAPDITMFPGTRPNWFMPASAGAASRARGIPAAAGTKRRFRRRQS